ncbi:Uroporphyrinogen decarboxylase 1, chloroplastic, partial [Ananas comosus]
VEPLSEKSVAARGNSIARPPAWMMRQAGRYMSAYQKLAEKHPSFRERSETVDLIVEITLQPWRAFKPDGVIIFSDILTPLPAIGVPFEISDAKGPIIQSPVQFEEHLENLHPIDLEKLQFVDWGECGLAGFCGRPMDNCHLRGGRWNNQHIQNYKTNMLYRTTCLEALLSHLTKAIADYIIFQVNSGAQCIQIFDSWGGQLPPHLWEDWSKPYIKQIVSAVRKQCPQVPIVLYINGNGGLLERMKGTGVDVIGLDWTVDMADGRRRLGNDIGVQGNVDPALLFSPLPVLTDEIHRVVKAAGRRGHILNLGHGVLVQTPEEAVAHFFEVARGLRYDTLFEDCKSEQLETVG